MENFIYYDFEQNQQGGRGCSLSPDKIRIYNVKGNRRVVVNPEVSERIVKSGMQKLRVREDPYTGEIALIFNNEKGKMPADGKRIRSKSLIYNCTALVELLVRKLHLEDNGGGAFEVAFDQMHVGDRGVVITLKR